MEDGCCVLAVLNATVFEMNRLCCQMFPGEAVLCYSADEVYDSDDKTRYPPEYLNSLSVAGVPEHCLILKVGMPVILLRNLNPADGLCNGVRLIVKDIVSKRLVVACSISHPEANFLIPRINLVIEETTSVPLKWRRRQFPLAQAFALTINKVQGQTLQRVAVWLENPVFSHGQFYTAASRISDPHQISFFVPEESCSDKGIARTKNVVYHEVL